MPPWIGAPLPRVSTIRHGASPINGNGLVKSIAVRPLRDFAGLQVAGADQFGMASPPRARLARKTEVKPRDEALCSRTEHLLLKLKTEKPLGRSVSSRWTILRLTSKEATRSAAQRAFIAESIAVSDR